MMLETFIVEFVCIVDGMKCKVLHFDEENNLSRMENFTCCWKPFN